jgi:hypothetical protein
MVTSCSPTVSCGCQAAVSFAFTESLVCNDETQNNSAIAVTGPGVVVDMAGFSLTSNAANGDGDNIGIRFIPELIGGFGGVGGTVKNGIIQGFDTSIDFTEQQEGVFPVSDMMFKDYRYLALVMSATLAAGQNNPASSISITQSTFDSALLPDEADDINPSIEVANLAAITVMNNVFHQSAHPGILVQWRNNHSWESIRDPEGRTRW